jgi:hypothetical protein
MQLETKVNTSLLTVKWETWKLRQNANEGTHIRGRRQILLTENIQTHVSTGTQPFRICHLTSIHRRVRNSCVSNLQPRCTDVTSRQPSVSWRQGQRLAFLEPRDIVRSRIGVIRTRQRDVIAQIDARGILTPSNLWSIYIFRKKVYAFS